MLGEVTDLVLDHLTQNVTTKGNNIFALTNYYLIFQTPKGVVSRY